MQHRIRPLYTPIVPTAYGREAERQKAVKQKQLPDKGQKVTEQGGRDERPERRREGVTKTRLMKRGRVVTRPHSLFFLPAGKTKLPCWICCRWEVAYTQGSRKVFAVVPKQVVKKLLH